MGRNFRRKSLQERIRAKVIEDSASGCWVWQGSRSDKGYGLLAVDGRYARVHRIVWELANGASPGKLHVLHRCDNPSCVRADHLFLGTNLDNVADRATKNRSAKGSANASAKLTEARVREIRADTRSNREMAQVCGVSSSTISDVRTRRVWGHVS